MNSFNAVQAQLEATQNQLLSIQQKLAAIHSDFAIAQEKFQAALAAQSQSLEIVGQMLTASLHLQLDVSDPVIVGDEVMKGMICEDAFRDMAVLRGKLREAVGEGVEDSASR